MNNSSSDYITISVNPTCKQTFIGIWLHDKNISSSEQKQMITYLHRTFFYYQIFNDLSSFFTYIEQLHENAKIFLIISDNLQYLSCANLCKKRPNNFIKIYFYLSIQTLQNDFFQTSCKELLFNRLSQDILEFARTIDSIHVDEDVKPIYQHLSIGSIPTENIPVHTLDKNILKLLFYLIMTNILCKMNTSERDRLEMWIACRRHYLNDHIQLNHIDELKENYKSNETIRYYTNSSLCLSRVINKAFHTENMPNIYTFRSFISDLHNQLKTLHSTVRNDNKKNLIGRTVYRGKVFSNSILQQLLDSQNRNIFMNGFLSTSLDQRVASLFRGNQDISSGYSSVLFKIKINSNIFHPFAYISQLSSNPDEAEVLFSPGIIWHIDSFTKNDNLYTFNISPSIIHESLRTQLNNKYSNGTNPLMTLADILREIGDDKEAEWFYEKVLTDTSINNTTRKYVLYSIGQMRMDRQDYSVALHYFNESVKYIEPNDSTSFNSGLMHSIYMHKNNITSTAIHNNRGLLYAEQNDYSRAIQCFDKALTQNGSSVDKAIVNNNLGVLYYEHGDYGRAYAYHLNAIDLIDKTHRFWPEFKRNFDRVEQRYP